MAYCRYLPVAFHIGVNMRRNIGKNLAVFFLLLLCFFLVLTGYFIDRKEQKELVLLQEKYERQDKELGELQEQLSQKRRSWHDIKPKGFVILAFSEENQHLMDSIKPEMEKRGLTGTVVIKNKGNVAKEEIEKWTHAGWDIALGGEIGREKEQREQFLTDFKKFSEICKTYDIQTPEGFFFNGGEVSHGKRLLYPIMKEYSYSMAVMFAQNENQLNYSVNQEYGELKECQNVSLRGGYDVVHNILAQVKTQGVPVVLSDFGKDNQMEISQEESIEGLTEILDFIQEEQKTGELKAGSIQQYLDYLSEIEEEKQKAKKEYESFEQEIKEKRKEIQNTYE